MDILNVKDHFTNALILLSHESGKEHNIQIAGNEVALIGLLITAMEKAPEFKRVLQQAILISEDELIRESMNKAMTEMEQLSILSKSKKAD